MNEIEAWVKAELAEGGTITKQEAHDELQDFADNNDFEITEDMWNEAEMAFDYVDADGNGEIDAAELGNVLKEHGGDRMLLRVKAVMKGDDWPELTPEQWQELEDWGKDQLANGGTITKKEAKKALKAFAKKHNFKITKDMWK